MNERLLDAATYRAVRRPLLEAEALPPACYTSPEFFALERERIFMKVWNFVGDVGLVPNPGDYHAFDYAGVPVLLVRDRAGTVRAFANTCRHKGSRIVSGDGSARALKCPYHGWVYGLDGKLTGAP
ncbi:MAG: aromatic ring-hydroxylating oxygenase subunit alpha [Alphaproteobacteria bacterium]